MTDLSNTPTSARPEAASPFFRAGGRNRFTARRGRVIAVEQVSPVMRRVRVTGPEFADFTSGGPADHVKVFFPDPETGELVAPSPVGPDEDGIVRPEGPMHARDFTPLRVTETSEGVAVDLDFYLHPSPGPASRWAAQAKPGDELVIVGPRGSRGAPQGAGRLVLVCDETALPSATRWAAEVPATTSVELLAVAADDGAWIAGYVSSTSGRVDIRVSVLAAGDADALLAALEAADVDASTFVFAAGEASTLIPVRRHLKGTLALPSEQFAVSGYWKRGTVGFDHHAPIDPADPD
ncbi:siderophore-interacting protein [Microbacterium sp. NEAU-LLC]|uniref:Siderophore-interacting protein n=1 Tax=Microbacterium helvum TaxID=2773713 RepID=A0ABR8NSI6_9MICO|nr:siderophore-interacting protein [Microbacterium helvum]MBD3943587.1 siderophore-interacting protein [Microbacterium helvum]